MLKLFFFFFLEDKNIFIVNKCYLKIHFNHLLRFNLTS